MKRGEEGNVKPPANTSLQPCKFHLKILAKLYKLHFFVIFLQARLQDKAEKSSGGLIKRHLICSLLQVYIKAAGVTKVLL